MKLQHIKLGLFPSSSPDNGTALVMNFQHMPPGFVFGKSQNFSEYVCDVAHEVHGIVVNDNIPGCGHAGLCARFGFWDIDGRHERNPAEGGACGVTHKPRRHRPGREINATGRRVLDG